MQREKVLNIEERSPIWFSVIIVICYAVYTFLSPETQTYVLEAFALAAYKGNVLLPDRPIGNIPTLITHIFLHGGWAHVLLNAGMMLAFGVITIRGVKNRYTPISGRFDRGSLIFIVLVLAGAIGGGLLQWLVWIVSGSSGLAVGASTSGAALFATTAWALGGRQRLLVFGIIIVAYDMFVLSTQGIASGLGNPAWAGHLGGYLAGALLAPIFINASSVGIGTSSNP